MSFFEIIDMVLFKSLELLFEVIYVMAYRLTDSPGFAIIGLSLCMNILILPLYMRADAMQKKENETEKKLQKWVSHIKKNFKGDERMMMLQTYYRQNGYKPVYALRGAVPLLLQIPFFIAAYRFLSGLTLLNEVSFGPIPDLAKPDGMLTVGGVPVNVLPIAMTVVNFVSSILYTRGEPRKTKIQVYGMALFFLVFLYDSPSGLVFYWTLNNVFSLGKTVLYKLKTPGKTLAALLSCLGMVTAVYWIFISPPLSFRKTLFAFGLTVLLEIPIAWDILKTRMGKVVKCKRMSEKANGKVFFGGALFLAVLTGLLIPSAVICSSPLEFTDITYFYHPMWYIVGAACLSFGIFVVWMGVFYFLSKPSVRPVFDAGIWFSSGVALVDYMFFGKKLGTLTFRLQYENGIEYSRGEMICNLFALVSVLFVFWLLYKYRKKVVFEILTVCVAAFFCMTFFNMSEIISSVEEIKEEEKTAEPITFELSKNGKNVIVLMLDRAMGEYVPYLLHEKPELLKQFDGFTYYPNVVSLGSATNMSTPSLFGGYEYTPAEINKRDAESLKSKHNEALLVMPVIFSESGFDVTVCDPPLAGYRWIPDLSVYDSHPGIAAYITKGKFTDLPDKIAAIKNSRKRFFCHSIFKVAPVCMQDLLYYYGNYCCETFNNQVREGLYTASGIDDFFMESYRVLENLSVMTDAVEEDKNTFLVLTNDVTHDPMMLQLPEYTPAKKVDNVQYEKENKGRFRLDGHTLKMETELQVINYQTNMAALLKLGEWFDYMREEGVYDNTRVILISDHGRNLGHLAELQVKENYNIEACYPVMMVKDFNREGFSVDETFMTLADVPTLATKGVIDAPVNPFTGKSINSGEKTALEQYVIGRGEANIKKTPKNMYTAHQWYAVRDDMRDPDNWRLVGEDTALPEDMLP